MPDALNTETASSQGAVETVVSIRFPAWTCALTVWCSRYTWSKLRREDWAQAVAETQAVMDDACTYLAARGVLPSDCADELNARAKAMVERLIHEAFRRRNVGEGNLIFQIDPMLREEYTA